VNTAASTTLVINKPAATGHGDVLVASLALNGATIASAPTGWVQIAAITNLSNPKLYSYYRVAGSAEPASYTWALSSSAAGSGGLSRYSGVSNTNPLADPANIASSTAPVASLTVPAVTTTSPGAMLVGSAAINSSGTTVLIESPAGMTERWDLGGKRQGYADALLPNAGSSGDKTWTFSAPRAAAAWLAALRPQ
jgi:hypothetical protein